MISDNRHLISGLEFSQLARLHRRTSRVSSSTEPSTSEVAVSPSTGNSKPSLIQPRRRFFR